MSFARALGASFRREATLALRQKSDVANPLIFYLMVIVFVPLGISAEPAWLSKLAPGVLWVVALLATLLSIDGLFRSDFEDGSLEQMMLSPVPLAWLVMSKVGIFWATTGLALTFFAPVLGVMLQLPYKGYAVLMVSLALGSASLCFIGAIGAALTVGLRKGGLLLSLIIMPFYVPVLIFGSAAVQNTIEGFSAAAELAVLAAMLVAWVTIAPFVIATALKIAVKA